ncbi:MAG: GNAT family N-acetyltransferase [Actinomycetota bacterium]
MSEGILRTKRLWLRPFRVADLDDLAAILGDPETMRFYSRPYTREECLEWIHRNVARYEERSMGLWAIELIGSGEFIGDCGPVPQVVDGREEIELGWHVSKRHWRKGFGSEAAAACRDHAFETLGLRRLIALIRPENVRSRRLAERIGMTVERETSWGRGGWPHLVYVVERT